ncbi:MAG: TRAP transporter small permease [Planctomycetota bacterium]|jgi:TRAP-type C4-dicarboxylate transport system permease small subunit|nr:TRAP transporter small permease [Planctomycetota bacterium]
MDDQDAPASRPSLRQDWRGYVCRNPDDLLAALCLAGLIGLMFFSILMRYLFKTPLMWSEEVITLLFMWVIGLGAVSAQKTRRHLVVDLLTAALPPRLQVGIGIPTKLVYLAVVVATGYYGWLLSLMARDKITNMLSIPYTYMDIAIPVGMLGMAVFILRDLRRDFLALFPGRPGPPIQDIVAEIEAEALRDGK